ncbi:condensin-2 complex subunit D3-like [Tachypleus tridentatus]|uniref:condensin-2 complex subunit D3-like n=1 Tax=Tachypleus tridentatus TaxID=6853 RepID=UPI003FCFFCAC
MAENENLERNTLQIFTSFPLEVIDDDLVTCVWNSSFTEDVDLPNDEIYSVEGLKNLLVETTNLCRTWAGIEKMDKSVHSLSDKRTTVVDSKLRSNNNNGDRITGEFASKDNIHENVNGSIYASTTTNFWSILIENGVHYKQILVLLYFLMKAGIETNRHNQKSRCIFVKKEYALISSQLYFTILRIPGSSAFRIFQGNLFQMAVYSMRVPKQASSAAEAQMNKHISKKRRIPVNFDEANVCREEEIFKPSKRRKEGGGQNNNYGKCRKNKKGYGKGTRNISEDDLAEPCTISNPDGNEAISMEGFSSDEGEDEVNMSLEEIQKLMSILSNALSDLITLLEGFTLQFNIHLIEQVIQQLAELTKIETEKCLFFDSHHQVVNIRKKRPDISLLAFVGLKHLCQPVHGDVELLVLTVMKYLLPNILMLSVTGSQSIPRAQQIVKDNTVNFICYLIKKNQEATLKGARVLFQHLCTKVVDKSDFRCKVAQACIEILKCFPTGSFAEMVEWLHRLVRHAKVNYRVFSLELFSLLVNEPERNSDTSVPKKFQSFLHVSTLLSVILARCNDKAASVRAKALNILALCTSSTRSELKAVFLEMLKEKTVTDSTKSEENVNSGQTVLVNSETDVGDKEKREEKEKESSSGQDDGLQKEINQNSEVTSMPSSHVVSTDFSVDTFMELISRRCSDQKVNVRKASLQVLENILIIKEINTLESYIKLLETHCLDPAVLVRKQAVQSLSNLLESSPLSATIQKHWMQGVLPLVLDAENSIQEKCLEMIDNLLLQNIVSKTQEAHWEMAWKIMDNVASNEYQDMQRYLQKAIQMLGKQGKIRSSMVNLIKTQLNGSRDGTVWLVLVFLSLCFEVKNPEFVLEYWEKCYESREPVSLSTMQRVLHMIGNWAKHMPLSKLQAIKEELATQLQQFTSPPELIATCVETFNKICLVLADVEGEKMIHTWSQKILKLCDVYLSSVILEDNVKTEAAMEEQVVRHLYTLGEVAQLSPTAVPTRAFLLIQSLIASPVISAAAPEMYDVPCSQMTQPSQTPLSQFRGAITSPLIRAHAFVALGKLCLQNEDFAKKSVAALAKELECSEDPTVRNNVVVIMADLCVRYTILVDPYISSFTACLRDSSSFVRKQTLTLMTQLLQEDYIKWRGTVFYRMVMTLVDSNEDIRCFAEYCLGHLLLRRHPHIFYQHFVECIFYFNCYLSHNMYNKFNQTDREVQLFSLRGSDNQEKRMTLYRFMLENINDEERFYLNLKLCQDVLGAVTDGIIPLSQESEGLIQDALAILCCEEIKLSSLTSSVQDEVEDGDMAGAIVATAKKTIISQVVKRNVIENVVPIVIGLKHRLEENKSPLLKDLMLFLRELMKDYKSEVKEIMSADKQLANEIEFDLRRFEQQQEEEKQEKRNIENALRQRNLKKVSENGKTPQPVINPAELATPHTVSRIHTPKSNLMNSVKEAVEAAKLVSSQRRLSRAKCSRNTRDENNSPNLCGRQENALNRVKLASFPIVLLDRMDVEAAQAKLQEISVHSLKKAGEVRNRSRIEEHSQTPKKSVISSVLKRAISTPSGVISNITFQNSLDVSDIPFVASNCEKTKTDKGENSSTPSILLHLQSPEVLCKPRVWHLKT